MLLKFLLTLFLSFFQTTFANQTTSKVPNQDQIQTTGVRWEKLPKFVLTDELNLQYLNHNPIRVHVLFITDAQGHIKHVKIVESSKNKILDQLVIDTMLKAKMTPYLDPKLGIYMPIHASQTFIIEFPKDGCSFENPSLCGWFN